MTTIKEHLKAVEERFNAKFISDWFDSNQSQVDPATNGCDIRDFLLSSQLELLEIVKKETEKLEIEVTGENPETGETVTFPLNIMWNSALQEVINLLTLI